MFHKITDRDYEFNKATCTLMRHIEKNVRRYKLRDLKAGRALTEAENIDAQWRSDRMNSRCIGRGCCFEFDFTDRESIIIQYHKTKGM